MNYLMTAANDIDIMIKGLFSYKLFGQEFWITTTHISILIVMATIIILAVIANRSLAKKEEVPGTIQNIAELVVEKLDGIVSGSMGENASKFRNYIGCIFIFIFISNISGIFGLRPTTADYGVTLMLGVITFVMIQYNGIKVQKGGYFTGLFKPIPILFPVNVISEFATPVSLSLRLFGNIMSGTVIMALWYAMVPIFFKLGVPAALHVYFDLFAGAIQTYVFCMLTMTYIQDKMNG